MARCVITIKFDQLVKLGASDPSLFARALEARKAKRTRGAYPSPIALHGTLHPLLSSVSTSKHKEGSWRLLETTSASPSRKAHHHTSVNTVHRANTGDGPKPYTMCYESDHLAPTAKRYRRPPRPRIRSGIYDVTSSQPTTRFGLYTLAQLSGRLLGSLRFGRSIKICSLSFTANTLGQRSKCYALPISLNTKLWMHEPSIRLFATPELATHSHHICRAASPLCTRTGHAGRRCGRSGKRAHLGSLQLCDGNVFDVSIGWRVKIHEV